MKKQHVYKQTYKDYLNQIAKLDFNFIAHTLGAKIDGEDIIIPFFQQALQGFFQVDYRPIRQTAPPVDLCHIVQVSADVPADRTPGGQLDGL